MSDVVGAEIGPYLELLRETRRRTLARTASLTQAELDARPAPDVWSVGEVLDHLVKAEAVYREDLGELLRLYEQGLRPEVNRSPSEFGISLRLVPRPLTPLLTLPLTLFSQLSPSPVRRFMARVPVLRVRNAERTTPAAGRAGDALRAELAASLEETLALFRGTRGDLPWHAMRATYPLIGTRTLPELLVFAADHEERHQRQIDSILRQVVDRN